MKYCPRPPGRSWYFPKNAWTTGRSFAKVTRRHSCPRSGALRQIIFRRRGNMADTATVARPKTELETRGQIVIEFADDHNSYHMWAPVQESFRGRWLNANIPSQQKDQDGVIDAVGDIPGIRVAVDISRR